MLATFARQRFGMLTLVTVCGIGCHTESSDGVANVGGSNTGGKLPSSAVPSGATSSLGGFGLGGVSSASGGVPAAGGKHDDIGGNAATGGTLDVSSKPLGGSSAGGASNAAGGANNATGGKSVGSNASGAGGRSSGGASMLPNSMGGKSTAASGGVGAAGAAKGGAATGGTKTTTALTGGIGNGGTASTATGGAATGGSSNLSTAPIKVWIAGDSTVQNCSSSCPCGWGSQFDPLFNANVTVTNSAVGGRSIQTWLYEGNVSSTLGSNGECTLTSTTYNARWTNMTNATSGMKPGDYLLIQFGINDGDSTCPRHVGTTLYKTYLTTMAKAAKALGAQPIFLTPTSAIACSGSSAKATRGFLTETKAAGVENDVPVIDLHQLTIDLYTKVGLCPNSEDWLSTTSKVGLFFCEDHTHFEAAGAKQIAQVVAQALKDQGIGLAAYLL